jgi:hypothetical protein
MKDFAQPISVLENGKDLGSAGKSSNEENPYKMHANAIMGKWPTMVSETDSPEQS